MAKCRDCAVPMGYAESQAAQSYNGLCITCHVKDRVQTKVMTSKDPVFSTTQKSTETILNKFEDMLVTTESSINLRIKARCGIISTDFHYSFEKKSLVKKDWSFFRSNPIKKTDFLQESIELAILELKAKAIRVEENGIIGLNVEYLFLGDLRKDGLFISLVGTGIKI